MIYIVDSWNSHSRLTTNCHAVSSTVMYYHSLWTCSKFPLSDDGFSRLTTRMIVHDRWRYILGKTNRQTVIDFISWAVWPGLRLQTCHIWNKACTFIINWVLFIFYHFIFSWIDCPCRSSLSKLSNIVVGTWKLLTVFSILKCMTDIGPSNIVAMMKLHNYFKIYLKINIYLFMIYICIYIFYLF